MPKIVKPLNDKEIKNAKPKEKEYPLNDVEGLYLLIKPDGIKLWIFRYTNPSSKQRRRTSFGTYPKITLADARKKRLELQNIIKQKIDPIVITELYILNNYFEKTF